MVASVPGVPHVPRFIFVAEDVHTAKVTAAPPPVGILPHVELRIGGVSEPFRTISGYVGTVAAVFHEAIGVEQNFNLSIAVTVTDKVGVGCSCRARVT